MNSIFLGVFFVLNLFSVAEFVLIDENSDNFIYGTFPSNFKFGVGTSSYQTEGAWDVEGKAESIWDKFTHENPSPIKDGSTGDNACHSYNNTERDVQLVKNIGVDFYRFSVSWPRILPNGTLKTVNQPGLNYYNNLIDSLIHHNLIPVISIHHWDLPLELQKLGGWLNPDIIHHFANYARLLYQNFGDRVKLWFTFNEAWVICVMGYGDGVFAPGIKQISTAPYICIHNILKDHAKAYRLYQREFKDEQRGQVGISIDSAWLEPADPNNPRDVQASERALHFKFGMFANPIVYGQYPETVRKYVDRRSKQEGLAESRLPEFDNYWSEQIKGSFDIIGLNHYSTYLVTPAKSDIGPGWYGDQNVHTFQSSAWPDAGNSWLKVVPWGFRKVLNWIKTTYKNPPLIVTENGYSDLPGVYLNDQGRIEYYKGYINNLLKAVIIDGCNVKGYSVWSLMDNFEWASGYTERFGLHWVNFTDPERQIIPKKSVSYIRKVFQSRGFPRPSLPWNIITKCEFEQNNNNLLDKTVCQA